MAKVFGGLFSAKASGKFSPGLIFRCHKQWLEFASYKARLRRRNSSNRERMSEGNPKFVEQQENFKKFWIHWNSFTDEDKALWKEFSKKFISRDPCTYMEGAVAHTVVACAFALVALATGGAMPTVPTDITAGTMNYWDNVQAAKMAAGRTYQVLVR